MEVRQKYKKYNYQAAFDFILNDFRQGHLGKVTLDSLDITQTQLQLWPNIIL